MCIVFTWIFYVSFYGLSADIFGGNICGSLNDKGSIGRNAIEYFKNLYLSINNEQWRHRIYTGHRTYDFENLTILLTPLLKYSEYLYNNSVITFEMTAVSNEWDDEALWRSEENQEMLILEETVNNFRI